MTDNLQPLSITITSGPDMVIEPVSASALMEIVVTAVRKLGAIGVTLDPAVQIGLDTLAERVLEHEARQDPTALPRALAAAEDELAAGRRAIR